MFKVNSKDTRMTSLASRAFSTNFEHISHRSSVYIVNFEHLFPRCEGASKIWKNKGIWIWESLGYWDIYTENVWKIVCFLTSAIASISI